MIYWFDLIADIGVDSGVNADQELRVNIATFLLSMVILG